MIKTITEAIIDGYGSGETSFLARLGQSDVQVQSDIQTNIIEPLLAVLNSSDQTAVLTVAGHSDRVDTAGLTREQRRQEELTASETRANDAAEGVKQLIRDRFLLDAGVLLPVDLDDIQQLAILPRVAGAAVLRESAEELSEEQRRLNRRVQMRVVSFRPG